MAAQKKKQPFWVGGAAASMAVCFTHPLDQTKYRMQVLQTRTTMLSTLYKFAVRDGFTSLWSGLSASILRQSTYSTARFGLYNFLSRQLQQSRGSNLRLLSVVLVRMCADAAKPAAERFGYPDAATGLYRIWKDEGLKVFGRGLSANVVRSVLMNVSQIAPYAAAKRALLSRTALQDDIRTHALASLFAGTVATTACAPADVLKSRIQSAAKGSSVIQVIREGMRSEGPLFLMKGWTPAWLRLT
ncbi:mitochondrial carrier domain-containing protein [Lasiosphaeria miniovina]|uniref:Mitochondrial carrier domain-containing protein n=1 Tax=Lasiosphaeria miniovina TaxID=1954250 RepID=A0AA40AC45_9PEZI|nr:mitochondrial carrier domain-containing protein [Lasiosphaeria miniovina]KAK0713161.1 mitochondrial carrier domain-containing protein [Lasiosphaeria miniovina]